MEKNIRDYLPFYIGCEGIAESVAPFRTKLVAYNSTIDLRNGIDLGNAEQYKFKPLLRPLDTMTEEEKVKMDIDFAIDDGCFGEKFMGSEGETSYAFVSFGYMAEMTNKLRKAWFDVDGLIPEGLALDTKEVNHA